MVHGRAKYLSPPVVGVVIFPPPRVVVLSLLDHFQPEQPLSSSKLNIRRLAATRSQDTGNPLKPTINY